MQTGGQNAMEAIMGVTSLNAQALVWVRLPLQTVIMAWAYWYTRPSGIK